MTQRSLGLFVVVGLAAFSIGLFCYDRIVLPSRQAAAQQKRIDEQEWAKLRKRDSILGYRDYLRLVPESSHAARAKTRIRALGAGIAAATRAERHPRLRNASGLRIDCRATGDGASSCGNLQHSADRALVALGLSSAPQNNESGTLEFQLSTAAINANYMGIIGIVSGLHYTGAEVSGTITVRDGSGALVASETFSGVELPPQSIESPRTSTSDAPFAEAIEASDFAYRLARVFRTAFGQTACVYMLREGDVGAARLLMEARDARAVGPLRELVISRGQAAFLEPLLMLDADPSIVEPISDALRSDWSLESNEKSVRALVQVYRRTGDVRPILVLIAQLADDRPSVRSSRHEALVAIAGKDMGLDPAAWRDWLQHRKKERPVAITKSR